MWDTDRVQIIVNTRKGLESTPALCHEPFDIEFSIISLILIKKTCCYLLNYSSHSKFPWEWTPRQCWGAEGRLILEVSIYRGCLDLGLRLSFTWIHTDVLFQVPGPHPSDMVLNFLIRTWGCEFSGYVILWAECWRFSVCLLFVIVKKKIHFELFWKFCEFKHHDWIIDFKDPCSSFPFFRHPGTLDKDHLMQVCKLSLHSLI